MYKHRLQNKLELGWLLLYEWEEQEVYQAEELSFIYMNHLMIDLIYHTLLKKKKLGK